MKRYCLLLLIVSLSFLTLGQVAEAHYPAASQEGRYHLLVIASQWQYDVYDVVSASSDGVDLLLTSENTRRTYLLDDLQFPTGAEVTITLVSKDVQHGFAINELNIAVALNRPLEDAEFGEPVELDTLMPDEETQLQAFCHIFCGTGHPDVKRTIQVTNSPTLHPEETSSSIRLQVALETLTLLGLAGMVLLRRTNQFFTN